MSLPNHTTIIPRLALFIALTGLIYLATAMTNGAIIDSLNDKASHFLAFYALALLVDFAFPKKDFGMLKVFELLAFGLLIEVIQYLLPYRSFSLFDLMANGAGLLAYKFSIPTIKGITLLRARWAALAVEE